MDLQENEAAFLSDTSSDITDLILGLAREGDRATVVLGTARIDVALENLLKKLLHHNPDGADNLFDPDRPLGTFSAKISLAYRLGAIDKDLEHALQMVRKIRNDFAHSIAATSLSEPRHKGRVIEITNEARKMGGFFSNMQGVAKMAGILGLLADFSAAIAVLVVALELARFKNDVIEVGFIGKLKIEPDIEA